jgi:hypothetical protein
MKKQTDSLRLRFVIATLVTSAIVQLITSAVAASPGRQSIGSSTRSRSVKPRLLELRGIDQLREQFQRDAGMVRAVVLISPT